MTTYARCTSDITVPTCNIRTDKGHKARKSQRVFAGQVLLVERQCTSTSLAHHGDPVLVLAHNGYQLHVLARYFQIFELISQAPKGNGE
jgi:hypothetical protein